MRGARQSGKPAGWASWPSNHLAHPVAPRQNIGAAAQWKELRITNQKATGSSPVRPTI